MSILCNLEIIRFKWDDICKASGHGTCLVILLVSCIPSLLHSPHAHAKGPVPLSRTYTVTLGKSHSLSNATLSSHDVHLGPAQMPLFVLIPFPALRPKVQCTVILPKLKADSENLKCSFLDANATRKMTVRKPFILQNPKASPSEASWKSWWKINRIWL